MASKTNDVSFRLKLLGWKQLADGAKAGASAIKGMGTEAETAGKKASGSSRGWGIYEKHTASVKRRSDEAKFSVGKLTKSLGALGIGYEAFSGVKESIDVTKELGEATLNLNKVQGLSLQQASQYAMVAQVRGIGQKQFAQALNILSRNTVNADKQWSKSNAGRVASSAATNAKLLAAQQAYERKIATINGSTAKGRVQARLDQQAYQQKRAAILAGVQTKAQAKLASGVGNAADAFKSLGFNQAQVRAGGKDLGKFMLELSERFDAMPGGAKKSQVALQLFGRGAQRIVPLFKEGNESLKTNLDWAKKYGVAMGGETPKQLRKFLVAQDKAHYATLGMQVALGQYLAPAVIKVMEAWPKLIDNIKKGKGLWGPLKTIITGVAGALSLVVGLFSKSKIASDVLVGGLALLGAAWGVEKILAATRALKAWWLITKVGKGAAWAYAAANTALSRSMATAMVPSLAGSKGRWASQGTVMGGWMGRAAGIAVAAAIITQLPNIEQWIGKKLHLGSSFDHEAKRGFRDLNPFSAENAGPKNEIGRLKSIPDRYRGLGHGDLARALYAHPSDLRSYIKQGLLVPQTRGALRGMFSSHHRKPPPGLANGGMIRATGAALIGENGPELLRLPKGAQVSPLAGRGNGTARVDEQDYAHLTTPVILQIDGKPFAQIMAKHLVKLRAHA